MELAILIAIKNRCSQHLAVKDTKLLETFSVFLINTKLVNINFLLYANLSLNEGVVRFKNIAQICM